MPGPGVASGGSPSTNVPLTRAIERQGTPAEYFQTRKMAAYWTLDLLRGPSARNGVELGAGIFRQGSQYFYGRVYVGYRTGIDNLVKLLADEEAGLPPGIELVGFVHTHLVGAPGGNSSEQRGLRCR